MLAVKAVLAVKAGPGVLAARVARAELAVKVVPAVKVALAEQAVPAATVELAAGAENQAREALVARQVPAVQLVRTASPANPDSQDNPVSLGSKARVKGFIAETAVPSSKSPGHRLVTRAFLCRTTFLQRIRRCNRSHMNNLRHTCNSGCRSPGLPASFPYRHCIPPTGMRQGVETAIAADEQAQPTFAFWKALSWNAKICQPVVETFRFIAQLATAPPPAAVPQSGE